MINSTEVNKQLYQLHSIRNRNVWIFHVVLILISTKIQWAKLSEGNYWWIALVTLGLGIALRFVLFRISYEKWKDGNPGAILLNYAGQFLLATGWAIHFGAVFYYFGPNSYHTSNTLIIIAGIITGASISSMAHPKTYHALCGTLCLYLLGMYLFTPEADKSILLYILLFYMFNTYNLRISNRQLLRSINNELHARSEEERITRIIDTVPGFVAVFNKDFVCTLANKATLSLYPDLLGRVIGNVEGEADWERHVINFLKSDKDHLVVEAQTKLRGKDTWMLRNYQRSFDGSVIYVSMNISELVLARKQLREQEGKAHYAAKLASLGEMAAGIAHEINNPLTIIQGSASVIQKLVEQDSLDKETMKVLTTKLIQTSERISKTIKSLKNLSRSGDNDPFEQIDFAKLLDQCLEISHQRIVRHGVTMKLPTFEGPVIITGREVQLSQVIMNLISNAIDAVKNVKDPWIEVCYHDSPDALDIYISDSGPGVPKEIREKIMEPFFTTKEVNQGTGLGLSISKSIMSAHKGELTLMEGTHTTFRMHLPK